MVRIRVRCFAAVRELLGQDELAVEVAAGTTVGQLKELLAERAPALRQLRTACAVNRAYAEPARPLADGDEVAFIPAISGGSGGGDQPSGPEEAASAELFRFELSEQPLDPRALEREVRSDRDGAVVTFAGVTRNHSDGQAVTSLRYEAYGDMAARLMVALFEEAVHRYPISRARVAHRLGEVPVGETSVLVVVAAEHRAAAFDACRFLMDRVKAELPVFKQERLAGDAGARWVGDLPLGRPEA